MELYSRRTFGGTGIRVDSVEQRQKRRKCDSRRGREGSAVSANYAVDVQSVARHEIVSDQRWAGVTLRRRKGGKEHCELNALVNFQP